MNNDHVPDNETVAINRKARERLQQAEAKLVELRESNQHLEGWELPDENDPEPVIVILVKSKKRADDFPARIAGLPVEIEVDTENNPSLRIVDEDKLGYDPNHPIFYDPKRPPWPPEGAA